MFWKFICFYFKNADFLAHDGLRNLAAQARNQDALKISKLVVLPGHILYPINWNDKIHQAFRTSVLEKKKVFSIAEARVLFPASLAVTYWSHSW